jgi:hypothetical protein
LGGPQSEVFDENGWVLLKKKFPLVYEDGDVFGGIKDNVKKIEKLNT